MSHSNQPDLLDVAIIGGGVAGVYSGWRLRTSDPQRSDVMGPLAAPRPDNKPAVGVFELSNRIGGRLLSLTPPEMPAFKAELGGMRYLTNQPLVKNLVDFLDIRAVPFPVGSDNNIYYLRGRHLREPEFRQADKVPYHLSWLENGKTPGELIVNAIDTIIPGATRLSRVEWQEIKENFKFQGEHLYNLGFWNVLHEVMSGEAYKLLLDAGGYVTTLSNWNAAEAMAWYLADFGPDATYMGIPDGYEQLPRRLASEFEAAGGSITYDARLTHFEEVTSDEHGPIYRLFFEGKPAVLARHIVLAMPRRSLELLDQDAPFFRDESVQDLIQSVTPHPMFKLFMAYRYPWWRDAGVNTGRSITDLPLRQIYYFGSEPDPGQYEAEIMDSLLMASYDDGRFVGFWTGMINHLDGLPRYDGERSRWAHHAAPDEMVRHAQRQLKLVHDLEYIPNPYAAAFVNWGQDPYGGAWNSWNIRVKAWEVQEQIIQPHKDWSVYVVGEAYSKSQGWVEGALETAEEMLTDKFDLREPRWVS